MTESPLPEGVHASISALLDHLEQKHGSSIVARTASYLTLSRTGLTESELADLLSSDNQVLVEYLQQEESPSSSMRVPQVDVERLLLDLRRFLIQRTVAGSLVLCWVSRHFELVVARRYFGNHEVRMEIHSEMADYFSGRWACGNAKALFINQKSGPGKDSAQVKLYIDRQPSSQPFVFTSSKVAGPVNIKKVIELPFHLQLSGRWEEMEHKLLISLRFHQAMLRAGLLGDLVAMFQHKQASSQFGFSREKLLLASILKSSACFLQSTPLQLPTVMETNLLPYQEIFPALEDYIREIRQERRMTGCALGVVLSPAPSSVPSIQYLQLDDTPKGVSVAEVAGTECGILVEILDDGSAWVWKSSERGVVKFSLSCEEKELTFAGVKSSGQFMLFSTHCNKLFMWDSTGPKVFLEVKHPLKAPSKIKGFVAFQKKLFLWWENESFVAVFEVSSETMTYLPCRSCVTCLACSTNGSLLFCGQDDGTVSMFDTETSSLVGTFSNHNAVTLIIPCEDKGEIAGVDKMGNITVWSVAAETHTPGFVKERCAGGKSMNISNTDYLDENGVLLVSQSHQVTLWDTCDWEILDQFLAPQEKAFTQAMLSQDSHLLLALLDGCAFILVWRVSTGQCVLSLDTNKLPHTLLKMASDVICVADNGSLTVWDSEMIGSAAIAPKMGCGVREVVIEQRGEWFYTSHGSEAVWRWDLKTGFPQANFLHDGPVEKLCLS